MSDTKLEQFSLELKELLCKYDPQWFLGMLSHLITCITNGMAAETLKGMSSPLRQLYYLGGLLVTSNPKGSQNSQSKEEWDEVKNLLNKIDLEYYKIFFPEEPDKTTEEWRKKCAVSIPSFLSYFNLGPLNYEEQSIQTIKELFTPLDSVIEKEIGLITNDFLSFYYNLDSWCHYNFCMFQGLQPNKYSLRHNWKDYSSIELSMPDVPHAMKELAEKRAPSIYNAYDEGIRFRFKSIDISSDDLPIEKVEKILSLLSCSQNETDFLFYTSTTPENPLYCRPIFKGERNIYQVFEIKQILHSIETQLDALLSKKNNTHYLKVKGDYVENRVVDIFDKYFEGKEKVYRSYYVDGHEKDILILWRGYAFIIEAKNYKKKEPFRDPMKAYDRIKQEFDKSIGYAYGQIYPVESIFENKIPLDIKDENGNIVDTIDTSLYEDSYFTIIVNTKSFGQIQVDMSDVLTLKSGSRYPWTVKLDDLEVFLLTLIQKKKRKDYFMQYLCMRDFLSGHIICSDELEICGGYIQGAITDDMAEDSGIIVTTPDLADIFDEQYKKGMGFKHEKYWKEKKKGDMFFW